MIERSDYPVFQTRDGLAVWVDEVDGELELVINARGHDHNITIKLPRRGGSYPTLARYEGVIDSLNAQMETDS